MLDTIISLLVVLAIVAVGWWLLKKVIHMGFLVLGAIALLVAWYFIFAA